MGSEAFQEELALLKPFQLGPFKLAHGIVMSPLSRCRSYGHVPQPHAAIYYSQRATPGGLLIAEGTGVNPTGDEYPETPGIFTQEQTESWKPIVKALHDNEPSSSSSYGMSEESPTLLISPMMPYSEPRALETEEIPTIVNDFVLSAKNAISAGFDGVELHGAHGYLLDQFQLNAPLNKYNRRAFYTQDPVVGYTDYPFLEESNPEFAKAQ
ncbi:unnamed protein product [Calypogeia fissa]